MTAPLLRASGLVFGWPGRPVFTGESFEFGAGITWLQGANGSGKSTLLKLLAGALVPRLGQCQVAGVSAQLQPLAYRRQVFWCGPGALPFGHLTPPQYFGFLAGLYPRFDSTGLAAHVAGFGLAPLWGQPLAALSTGSQRKVWLAAALCAGTAAVLVDEPLNALDAASLAHARQALAQHAHGPQAWVVASHEPPCDGAAALPGLRLP